MDCRFFQKPLLELTPVQKILVWPSKSDQIRKKLRIWSHLLEKSLMENLIFCAVFGADVLVPIFYDASFYLNYSVYQLLKDFPSFRGIV